MLDQDDGHKLDMLTANYPTGSHFPEDLVNFVEHNENFIKKHGLKEQIGKLLTMSLMNRFNEQQKDKYLKI
jgi:hypothetical protein